jgi:hypothetical protein
VIGVNRVISELSGVSVVLIVMRLLGYQSCENDE